MTAEQAEPYERAADDIRRLAEAHDTAMDTFARRVAHGLRGPAGKRLVDEARGHRDAMHQAFHRAWDDVAALIRRHGGHHGTGPVLARSPLGGYLSRAGSVRGVDEDALHMAMREAKHGGSALCGASRRLASILSRVGANPGPAYQVQEIGDWLLGQDHELRRRLNQALAAEATLGDAFAGLRSGVPALPERLDHLTDAQYQRLSALHEINKLAPGRERAQRTAAWWKNLSQTDRDQFIDLFPRTIGSLDGLPSLDRSRANSQVLASKIADLERLGSTSPVWLYDDSGKQRRNPERAEIDRQVDILQRLQEKISPDKNPPILLLFFDPSDIRRVAVSYDNPDTADNVVAFVPGFGTTDNLIRDNLDRAERIRGAARAADPTQDTASIYWLNYDAPTNFDVITEKNAAECAPALGGFMRGLEVAHTQERMHSTVLGHSYGSLAVGRTAVDYPDVADELIFVGSPGVGVDDAKELGIKRGHVWAGKADHDPVPLAPPEFDILVPHEWIREALIGDARFGVRPDIRPFGGRWFEVQPGPTELGVLPSIDAHSVYWDPGSTSLKNIGNITAGNY